jgi:SPFH domain-Band 7 family
MAVRNVISTLNSDGTEVMGPGILMYHHPGNDIVNGSLLTVESNHFCVLKSRGAILNVYETGQYPVETPQHPLLGSFQQAFYSGQSPWQYEALFVSRAKSVATTVLRRQTLLATMDSTELITDSLGGRLRDWSPAASFGPRTSRPAHAPHRGSAVGGGRGRSHRRRSKRSTPAIAQPCVTSGGRLPRAWQLMSADRRGFQFARGGLRPGAERLDLGVARNSCGQVPVSGIRRCAPAGLPHRLADGHAVRPAANGRCPRARQCSLWPLRRRRRSGAGGWRGRRHSQRRGRRPGGRCGFQPGVLATTAHIEGGTPRS